MATWQERYGNIRAEGYGDPILDMMDATLLSSLYNLKDFVYRKSQGNLLQSNGMDSLYEQLSAYRDLCSSKQEASGEYISNLLSANKETRNRKEAIRGLIEKSLLMEGALDDDSLNELPKTMLDSIHRNFSKKFFADHLRGDILEADIDAAVTNQIAVSKVEFMREDVKELAGRLASEIERLIEQSVSRGKTH